MLQKRLIERGSEPQESLKKRLVKARGEIENSKDLDRISLNDILYPIIAHIIAVNNVNIGFNSPSSHPKKPT